MVLVHTEDLLKLLLPGFSVDCARLELVFELLGAQNAERLHKGLLGAIGDGRILLFHLLGVEHLVDAVLRDLQRCLVGLHICVGAAELDVVQDAPIEVFDGCQDEVVVETEHVKGQEMRSLLGIAGDAERAADLEDEHGRIEGQVVELLSDILWLLIELPCGLFDALEDIKADFDRVLPRQLLVVLGVLLVVSLSASESLLDSALKLGDRAQLMFVAEIVRIIRISNCFYHLKNFLRFKFIYDKLDYNNCAILNIFSVNFLNLAVTKSNKYFFKLY